ncbi:hypothetical protein pb186bvf_009612 [Paramecium bursaria]
MNDDKLYQIYQLLLFSSNLYKILRIFLQIQIHKIIKKIMQKILLFNDYLKSQIFKYAQIQSDLQQACMLFLFDQILLQLVEYMGDNKWAEITRRMKTIFKFDIPRKAMVQARWRAIDPKINRDPFTAEDLAIHWQFCVRHKCNWDAVKAEYQLSGLSQGQKLFELEILCLLSVQIN